MSTFKNTAPPSNRATRRDCCSVPSARCEQPQTHPPTLPSRGAGLGGGPWRGFFGWGRVIFLLLFSRSVLNSITLEDTPAPPRNRPLIRNVLRTIFDPEMIRLDCEFHATSTGIVAAHAKYGWTYFVYTPSSNWFGFDSFRLHHRMVSGCSTATATSQ